MQALLAYLIVAVAACYAAWALIPRRARGEVAARLPLPRAWAQRLAAAATRSACASCKGCASGSANQAGAQPAGIVGRSATRRRH
jgi:cytochrome c2